MSKDPIKPRRKHDARKARGKRKPVAPRPEATKRQKTPEPAPAGYDRARAAVRDAVATGRDYYQRGTAAVARSAGDGNALTLLAAGTAVAALSWLVLGRRTGKTKP